MYLSLPSSTLHGVPSVTRHIWSNLDARVLEPLNSKFLSGLQQSALTIKIVTSTYNEVHRYVHFQYLWRSLKLSQRQTDDFIPVFDPIYYVTNLKRFNEWKRSKSLSFITYEPPKSKTERQSQSKKFLNIECHIFHFKCSKQSQTWLQHT